MRAHRIRAVVVLLVVGGLSILAPSPASASGPHLTSQLVDATLIGAQQHAVVKGRAWPHVRRPIRLQVQSSGSWLTVVKGHTKQTGRYRAVDPVSRAGTYRIIAPATRRNGRSLERLVSPVRTATIASTLAPGETMANDAFLQSPNGDYTFAMQADGNLVVYKPGRVAVWSAHSNGADRSLVMQPDGNLQVLSGGSPVWETTTQDFSGSYLSVQDDGNVVVYLGARALWSWKTGILYNQLRPGSSLRDGALIRSPNHLYRAVMQGDGNFVIYKSGGGATWSTATNGSGQYIAMQGDGNLVIYGSGKAVWNTKTNGFGTVALYMQDDGNLVIYRNKRPLWSSMQGTLFNQLRPGSTLTTGEKLLSESHTYRLVMQGDGNLVLYKAGTALWSTQTDTYPGARAAMQGDGNLVVYDADGTARWSSKTNGNSGARLALQEDANLVVYLGSKALWDRHNGLHADSNTADVADALTRGQTWVDAGVSYSQKNYYTNKYGTYRTDCSGYVSMMWNLGRSYVTWEFPDIAHPISKDQLRAGDILLSPYDHVLLFAKWADSSHTYYWAYEENPKGAGYRRIPYPYWSGYSPESYTPYRKD